MYGERQILKCDPIIVENMVDAGEIFSFEMETIEFKSASSSPRSESPR